MRTDTELLNEVNSVPWYHHIELRPGIKTPGRANNIFELSLLNLPPDLTGKTVLDIGCWDGFYSFECEKRGAKRVVATDVWEHTGRKGFDLAHEELNSNVEAVEASVYDLPSVLEGERFDLVLFLGVLYHLKHPLLAIEKVAECTKPGGFAFVETVVDPGFLSMERPVMSFFPGAELNNDHTNWWAPNIHCLQQMMHVAGFSKAYSVVQLYGGDRTIVHGLKASDEEVAALAKADHDARHLKGPGWR